MELLAHGSLFVEPGDLLDSPELPVSASPSDAAYNVAEPALSPQAIIDSCCDRHHRSTAAVSELHAVCHELVSSTASSELTLAAINDALKPYIAVEKSRPNLNLSSTESCQAHIRLLFAVSHLAAVPKHAESGKFLAQGQATARQHRTRLLQIAASTMDQWSVHPSIAAAENLSAQVAALQAGVSSSPVSRAACLLRLSSAVSDTLEAEDAAFTKCSEHFFAVRQDMLLRWSSHESDCVTAPQLCSLLRQTHDALRQEAALHNSIMRNKEQLDAMQVQSLCPTQQVLLQLPGEEAALAGGMAQLASQLLAPLAASAARPSSVGDLAEIMASIRDELAVMSAGSSSVAEQAASAALCSATEELLLSAVQERLMYAAERDITDALAAWQPSVADDVDFPARFQAYRRSVALRSAGGAAAGGAAAACDVTHTWFPPMYRCLRALSSLYRALTRGAFATCAQQAVAQLLAAMGRAAVAIAAKQGALHGQLFLISQLLILREQLAPFDVSLAQTQHHLALPSASDALGTLVRGLPGLLKWGEGNLLYDLLTGRMMPALVQVHTDGRRDLESSLKSACERFIGLQSAALAAPLSPLVAQGTQPEWEHAKDVLSQWNTVFCRDFPHLRRQLALYLGSAVTHRILLTPIADSVSQVLNKARAAATSDETAAASAAADAIRGALASVTAAMDEDDSLFDPHLPQYWQSTATNQADKSP